MLNRIRAYRAFTLIELLVVLVVIAVLAAIIVPKFTDQGRRSKDTSLKMDLAEIRSAISSFQTDTGYYPLQLSDLAATSAPTNGADPAVGTTTTVAAADWHGPYLQGSVPKDPVSGTSFSYSTSVGAVGKVTSSMTGADEAGVAYSSY